MSRESLSITDHCTGRSCEIPIEHGTIRAIDLHQIRRGTEHFGLMAYDPAFLNTASCRRSIPVRPRQLYHGRALRELVPRDRPAAVTKAG